MVVILSLAVIRTNSPPVTGAAGVELAPHLGPVRHTPTVGWQLVIWSVPLAATLPERALLVAGLEGRRV